MPRDVPVWLDARTSLREVRGQVRAARATFAVLYDGGDVYAFRADELDDIDEPALTALALAPWKASVRATSLEAAVKPLADPTAPSSWRTVHLDHLGVPLRVTEAASQARPIGGRPSREATSIVRHPSIDAAEAADHTGDVILSVDLALDADPATLADPLRFDDLPEDWTSFPVTVRVTSPQLVFADGDEEGTIAVRRDRPSVKCRLVGRRRPNDHTPLEVAATFHLNDRWCGTAQRTFSAGAPPATGAVSIAPGAHAPDLTVHIHRTAADRRRLVWTLTVAAAHRAHLRRASDESSLPDDPGPFLRARFKAVAGRQRGTHVAILRGLGERLWELTPPAFREAYWSLRRALGDGFSIQFVTDDPHIPWELMRPLADGVDTRLIGETHPVARGMLAYPDRLRPTLPASGDIITIAPDYTRRTGAGAALPPLPAALDESRALRDVFAAEAPLPTADAILAVLADTERRPVRLLHFAGHGHVDADIELSSIACEDGNVTVLEVRSQENQLGVKYGTFVIFNACEVGAGGEGLVEAGGWAEAFAYRHFGGFVAPLWAVFDNHASEAIEILVDAILRQRVPVGTALRNLRARCGQHSPTYLSYVYYGDVNARFG